MRQLSKSKIMALRQCPNRLWLELHRPELRNDSGSQIDFAIEPDVPASAKGDCPLHLSVIEQAFPDQDARTVFLAWLAHGVQAIRKHTHQPAPMLVMAGKAGAGKSLLAHISKQAMGGRPANPMTAWTGKLPWNDNLLAAELLLIDDSVSSTDPRARKAFGAHFKEAIYAGDVSINTRRKSAIELRPVWRVMVCCNETPENLSVIPPLEDGIEDKIILFKIAPITTAFDTRAKNHRPKARSGKFSSRPIAIASDGHRGGSDNSGNVRRPIHEPPRYSTRRRKCQASHSQ